ncbi:hypothetical protein HY625_01130 [Candidatus Uhrbacteria bacterium]|nr:hypothetical protein [Candidatus Uhrbacteria bacterium]
MDTIKRFVFPWKESREKREEAMRIPGRDNVPIHPSPKDELKALLEDEGRTEARESKNEVEQLLRSTAMSNALERARKNEPKDSAFLIILDALAQKHSAGTLNLRAENGIVLEQLQALQDNPNKTDTSSNAMELLRRKLDILAHLISISNGRQKI